MIQVEATFNKDQLNYIVDALLEEIIKRLSVITQTINHKIEMEMLSVGEVAKRLNVNQYTVRNWIKQKKLEATMAGSKYQISREELDNFLKRNNRYG